MVVEVEANPSLGQESIGINLGLKDVATCSDGTRLENGRFYRDLEPTLAIAQRAGKKARVRAIHTKIANRRKDTLHQFSRALVKRCGMIIVGDVSPAKLAKTTMAKSGRFSYGAALVLVDVSIHTPVQGVTAGGRACGSAAHCFNPHARARA